MPKKDPNYAREKEKYSTPIASREFILDAIKQADKPLTFKELTKLCNITDEELVVALKRRLRAMENAGQLIFNKFKKYGIPDEKELIKGKVLGHKDGFGFLQPDGKVTGKNDWYISHSQMRGLLPGDYVLAQPIGEFKGKTEARVISVIQGREAPIIGRYFVEMGVAVVVPDDSRIKQEILIEKGQENGARHGQMVIVELLQRPTKRSSAVAKVSEVLGEHMAPGMEVDIALRNHDIPFQWSPSIDKYVSTLSSEVLEKDKNGRVDLRQMPLVTIDGEDSRDFDDAVYCKPKDDGGWTLYVAIADVSHYVRHNSDLDKEAIERGNSVYFPSKVIPMLPEALSNGLCSLNPQTDRLCMVAEMDIDATGRLNDYTFYEAVMHSHARLTYTKVASMLKGDVELQQRYKHVWPHIQDLNALYKALKLIRAERGAFEFETIEPKFIFNAQQKIDHVEVVERNDAHKIIEECMIMANVAAAKFIEGNNGHALFRVHDKPDPSKLATFRAFLAELGGELKFSDEPSPKELSSQVNKYLNRPDGELIQTMMIRSMRQAVYQPDNIGHFGLALEGYAHFTSPIRRYPDLIVHRAIKAIIKKQGQTTSGQYAYNEEELEQLGEQCSMTERRADDATRDVESWLKCEFMQDHIDMEYEGVIASVTSFGLFVRLVDLHIEGLVHITALGKDYFNYSPERNALIGENSRQVFRLGDTLEVKVVSVNLEDKQIDFELVGVSGGRRRATNTDSNRSKKPSVREQLKKGKIPGQQDKEDSKRKPKSKSGPKRDAKDKPKSESKRKSKSSATKGKTKPKKKPKSRAAKRIAKKKSD
ncbi:ribonuclease R [Psychrosphaera aestuarii]|uniref:ribonuclease R n=1 Tax=Psychrosphaera aestuarii TaxID=1266052 RepID=UPI001B33C370|nr:ribonuclease R [Psychrosphaera aestuarii]